VEDVLDNARVSKTEWREVYQMYVVQLFKLVSIDKLSKVTIYHSHTDYIHHILYFDLRIVEYTALHRNDHNWIRRATHVSHCFSNNVVR
jgi:proteasome lid subunit RPN8/RPN11